jgi:hypothetical protein
MKPGFSKRLDRPKRIPLSHCLARVYKAIHRLTYGVCFAGITGSVGKTITTEPIAKYSDRRWKGAETQSYKYSEFRQRALCFARNDNIQSVCSGYSKTAETAGLLTELLSSGLRTFSILAGFVERAMASSRPMKPLK